MENVLKLTQSLEDILTKKDKPMKILTVEEFFQKTREDNLRQFSWLRQYPRFNHLTENPLIHKLINEDPVLINNVLRQPSEKWLLDVAEELHNFGNGILHQYGGMLLEQYINAAKKIEKDILDIEVSAPRCNLDEYKITKSRENASPEISYDFCPTTHKIEEVYKIRFRDVFDYQRLRKLVLNEFLTKCGWTEEEIDTARNTPPKAPSGEYVKTKVYHYLMDYTEDAVPYMDHWHYLLAHDFDAFRRGAVNLMSIEPAENEHPIFKKFREIYVTECHAAQDDNVIRFEIDW